MNEIDIPLTATLKRFDSKSYFVYWSDNSGHQQVLCITSALANKIHRRASLLKRKENRVYCCQDCKASFSGRGSYHCIRDHEQMTGHIMSKGHIVKSTSQVILGGVAA